MKYLFTCLLVAVACSGNVQAQNIVTKPKLSAFTRQFLNAYDKQGNGVLPKNFVYKKINNRDYISALIKVMPTVNEATLNGLGIYIGTKAGSIWTAQVPVENVAAFATTPGISYIELDRPVYPLLDSARKETGADSAQEGINLPMAMTGQHVVVGVIDAGFDFTHPTMYDTTNSSYRIKKVWTQKISGTPPSGFSYGSELTDTNAIKTLGYDTAILSHGTHVAGIAAGSGYGSKSNNKYRGMAYQSDIMMVGIMPAPPEWLAGGESDIIDGMNYLFTAASAIGEPAVVNLSWGSTIGPHDGSSLFSQACDALTGPGKIFVCAAGNNGQDTVHLQKTFSATDTTVSTFVTFSPYLDTNNLQTWVDAWGDSGKTFCVNVQLYNAAAAGSATGYVCLSADTTLDFNLIGSNGDTCFVSISTSPADYNGKPHATISFYSKVHDNICLTTRAGSGTVHMWEGYVIPPEGYYGYLKSLGYPWAVSGDVNYTVSDIGCTKSAITTGAYTSKTAFTNISGAALHYVGALHAHIAPFSSLGPTEDGRTKPDITAPGFALASSVNSFDTSYLPTGTNYSSVVGTDTNSTTGRIYKYAMLAGTSMASPCVSGIVAMMLQINPSLNPDEVKTILNATAITDAYTGSLPVTGTNTWGHGKINAYAAVSYLAQHESVQSHNIDPLNCILYPNPNKGIFSVIYTGAIQEQLTVSVCDAAGNYLNSQTWSVGAGTNTRQFSIQHLPAGLYFVRVSSPAGYNVIKMEVE